MAADPTDEDTVTLETLGGTRYFCCGGCRGAYRSRNDLEDVGSVGWRDKLLTAEGWDTAATQTMKEWEMLWEDIAIGFVIAGVVAAFVPEAWWAALFVGGGGIQAVVLNTLLGVLIGVATFMCSVGNVPFALVLWLSGLPFGGVLAFIYADLIIPPLVKIYYRYYGGRLAAALFGSIFVAALVAGVAVHYLLGGIGLIPAGTQTGGTLSGEYTVVLNLLFTAVFLAQTYVAYGPAAIRRWLVGLPRRTRRAIHHLNVLRRYVQRELWVLCLELAGALLLLGDVISLLLEALWTLWRAVRELTEVLADLLRRLWRAVRWLL
jgi:uncharacterized membrane protein YraQ (UPF0718 family)